MLTIMALVVAPICAPLCAATNCNSGGPVAASGSRCQHMAMDENSSRVESSSGAVCGNAEFAATLNGESDKDLNGRSHPVRTAAGDLARAREISYRSENERWTRCNVADTGPMQSSSSHVVLKI
jgi:hypothetical protein